MPWRAWWGGGGVRPALPCFIQVEVAAAGFVLAGLHLVLFHTPRRSRGGSRKQGRDWLTSRSVVDTFQSNATICCLPFSLMRNKDQNYRPEDAA